jgi:hypothetical protein
LQGSFSDLALIEQTSSAHDIVINAADSDDLPLTRSINRGLAHARKSGKKGVLVHVSGTQLIESPPTGNLDEGWPVYDVSGTNVVGCDHAKIRSDRGRESRWRRGDEMRR